MFAHAVEIASQFTFPVIISTRTYSGTVESGVAAFVLLNADGWIATAAHVFNAGIKADGDRALIEAHDRAVAAVSGGPAGSRGRLLKKLRGEVDPTWIRNVSYWFGHDGVTVDDLTLFPVGDLAIGRLNPLPPGMVRTLPVIKNPSTDLRPGTSLCRLGFPFAQVKATYDETTDRFSVDRQTPYFPLEGMFTRLVQRKTDKGPPAKFIETSAPGLLGHSGGPLFDVHARVWGIQSQTSHLPLGFRDSIEIAGKKVTVPPQFINLGWAIHPETITGVLNDLKVGYELSPD